AVIQPAAFCVSRSNHRLRAASHRVGAPIEAKAVHLLVGTMAPVTLFAQERLNVALKIHRRGSLGCEFSDRHDGEAECKGGRAEVSYQRNPPRKTAMTSFIALGTVRR